MIKDRIASLRAFMTEVGVSVCLIPTSDCHDSEYVSDFYGTREYFSGFTGSAGDLVVSMKEAALFTDSRYFLQAADELKGSGIKLMKCGLPDTPKLEDYIFGLLNSGEKLGFDGKLISSRDGSSMEAKLKEKGCFIDYEFDPASIWKERPALVFNPVYELELKYAGEAYKDKLSRVLDVMDKEETSMHIITALDDIAWLLNLRGSDIDCNPVFMSFVIIRDRKVYLYANIKEESAAALEYLNKNGIVLKKYDEFFEEGLQSVNNCTSDGLLLDENRISYRIHRSISSKVRRVNRPNPAYEFKGIKNEAEIAAIEHANVVDGVAVVKFDYFLREAVKKGITVTEMDVADKLLELRSKDESFRGVSFETIAGFGEHGAIVHYESSKETDIPIKEGSFLLVDSGGQYLGGTTDITRTYAIGEVDGKLKHDYTLVLKAMLRILDFQFLSGTTAHNIDTLCRDVFWKDGKDYGHGTGHGIGAFLNVHEMPVYIQWRNKNKIAPVVFEPGMLTSDEPGIYITGEYGIRIENDILCENRFTNEYGTFLGFRPMTLAPIDTSCILIDEMSKDDIRTLNNYHKLVFEKLSPFLEGDELEFLKDCTKAVG